LLNPNVANTTDEALRAMARYVELCDGDPEAIEIMRKLTGLTVTDPEADRPVMEQRLAEYRRASE
jgi:hypothetical protein